MAKRDNAEIYESVQRAIEQVTQLSGHTDAEDAQEELVRVRTAIQAALDEWASSDFSGHATDALLNTMVQSRTWLESVAVTGPLTPTSRGDLFRRAQLINQGIQGLIMHPDYKPPRKFP